MNPTLGGRTVGQFLGTAFMATAIVGSGTVGEQLAGRNRAVPATLLLRDLPGAPAEVDSTVTSTER